jgi:hypothetical protein
VANSSVEGVINMGWWFYASFKLIVAISISS